jgi:Spy/CpxP family protein refolding chaperone
MKQGIFIVSILIIVVTFAMGEDEEDYEKRFHIPKDLSFLELNSSQKVELKSIIKEQRVTLKKLHQKEELLEASLQKIFVKDSFDKKDFLNRIRNLKGEMAEVESNFFEKIHRILNREQRKKFIKYIEEWEIE